MAAEGVELPIFELPAVILPGELLPLHIFEERYQRLIGHCLENEEPFGIVFRDPSGNAHRIGCTARVAEVLERFDDGRLNIVVAGEQPFRVLERFETERMRTLGEALRALVATVARSREIAERAKMNGKVIVGR